MEEKPDENFTFSDCRDQDTFRLPLTKHIVSVHDHKVKLALLVIDINRFERINRLYDYPFGDLVLKQFEEIK